MDYEGVTETSFESTFETDFGSQEVTESTEFIDETTVIPPDGCRIAVIWLNESYFYWFFYSVS